MVRGYVRHHKHTVPHGARIVEVDEKHICVLVDGKWRPAILHDQFRNGTSAVCICYAAFTDRKTMKSFAPMGAKHLWNAVEYALRRKDDAPVAGSRGYPVLEYRLPPDLINELYHAKQDRLLRYNGQYPY